MLADDLRTLLERASGERFRIEDRVARAELGRSYGRIVGEAEFNAAVRSLRDARFLSERNRQGRRFLSKRIVGPQERDLYAPVRDWLETVWLPQGLHGLPDPAMAHVEVTAGARPADTRPIPDLMALIATGPEMQRQVHVVSFEVKPVAHVAAAGPGQAAQHSFFVNYAYLVRQIRAEPQARDDLIARCRDFGLGLILLGDPVDDHPIEHALSPRRSTPDPRAAADFVRARLPALAARYLGEAADE